MTWTLPLEEHELLRSRFSGIAEGVSLRRTLREGVELFKVGIGRVFSSGEGEGMMGVQEGKRELGAGDGLRV